MQSSSGLLRSLAFSRDLADLGWRVAVLTAKIAGEDMVKAENTRLIPDSVRVIRTRAIDAATKLSFRGRYPGILEWPDRYSSWVLSATLAGYREIKNQDLAVIFSTYPIASAHLVGYLLSKLTKKPWVADFRDPMIMAEHPDTKLRRRAHAWVERKTVARCSVVLVTNSHAKEHYIGKYPSESPEKFYVVENGFDEGLFKLAEVGSTAISKLEKKHKGVKILHSGTLYPNHRNPAPLFEAIKALSSEWKVLGVEVKFVFRASGYDDYYKAMIAKLGIDRLIEFVEPIGYVDSINEMLTSDALLVIQGSSCNEQVPAKLYEYLRAGKPIVSITDPTGATAATLRDAGVTNILDSDDDNALESGIDRLVKDVALSDVKENIITQASLKRFSRRHWSEQLADILHDIISRTTT